MRARIGWREGAVVATAVASLVITAADVQQHYRDGPAGAAIALAAARAVAVVLCLGRPLWAAALMTATAPVAAALLTPTSADEPWPWPVSSTQGLLAVLVCLGLSSAPMRIPLRAALLGTLLASHLSVVVVVAVRGLPGVGWDDLVPALLFSLAGAAVGDLVQSRRRVAGQLVAQQAATASEQDARLRAEERARIARELHDVVAHHLSVVVVRADSAPRRLPGLDDAAVAEFRAIGDDARESLEQMRRVLRLLRSPSGGDVQGTEPQPTFGEVAGLVAEARDAGATVQVHGRLPDADGVAGVVAFRTVQEALTNALRHAPGTPVDVSAERCDGHLVVRVENPAAAGVVAEGHGLRGMRERVEGTGGNVTAGHSGVGTFVVRAEIPVPRS